MLCPDCHHDNLAGAVACENCAQDLTPATVPVGPSQPSAGLAAQPLRSAGIRRPVCVARTTSLKDAVATMHERKVGCVLVGDTNEVLGIFTERDLLFRVGAQYEDMQSRPISELMTRDPEQLAIDSTIGSAVDRMTRGGFRHAPVHDAGKLVGIVSLRDFLKLMSKWYPDLIF